MNPELYADLRKRLAELEKGLKATQLDFAMVLAAAGGEVIVEKGAKAGSVERWERPDGSVRFCAVEKVGPCEHENIEPDILTACDVCVDCSQRFPASREGAR